LLCDQVPVLAVCGPLYVAIYGDLATLKRSIGSPPNL
jgi:hypothetical protein